MLTLNQTKTNTGEDDGWSAKWWSRRKGSLTDDRRSDGWSVMTEWGEREVRWSVRGRGWWSVWQKQWVCGRNSEWERVYSLNLKNILFETESLRLGFQIWNRVPKIRFPRVQPRHSQMQMWTPRKNQVLETRFPRGIHVDLRPRQV